MEYIEHRTYQEYVGTVDFDIKDTNHSKYDKYKTWMPYEQDYTHYPEIFKKYGENYKGYEELKSRFENEKPFQEWGDDPKTPRKPRDMSPWEKREADLLPRFNGSSCQ